MALVGGAKVSTKLELLSFLTRKVDLLAIGGAMANTFLFAKGRPVGRSLCEQDLADHARIILSNAEEDGCDIILPEDAVTAEKLEPGVLTRTVGVHAVPMNAMILDIGPQTVARISLEDPGADFSARDIRFHPGGTDFTLLEAGLPTARLTSTLTGRHNVRNALGAIALARGVGLSAGEITRSLARFEGVRRRLEIKGEARGIVVVDDFAHHPTAVRSTLLAARAAAAAQEASPLEWRILLALAQLQQMQGRGEDVAHSLASARKLVASLAANLSTLAEAEGMAFAQRADALFPTERTLTPLQAAKREAGGLTSREREIAVLIARPG